MVNCTDTATVTFRYIDDITTNSYSTFTSNSYNTTFYIDCAPGVTQLCATEIGDDTKSTSYRKARKLLFRFLDKRQKKSLRRHGYFIVTSQSGRIYKIYEKASSPKLVDIKGEVRRSYCIHPEKHYPRPDLMLAYKMMLENCEEDFLRML